VLPRSVVERTKSPYPSTQDPVYVTTLRNSARDVLADAANPVFDLIDREGLRRAVETDTPQAMPFARRALERALDLSLWLDIYKPTITTS
jgi:asparagine synthase (glutamine-hydrolysing)